MTTKPSSEVSDLFARAMIDLDEDRGGAEASLTGWAAIWRLHRLGSREVLDMALLACADSDPLKRRVGIAVLGQLGHVKPGFEPVFVDDRFRGLIGVLVAECAGARDPSVLSSACVALGHLQDPRAIPALLALRTHPDADVRSGVVSGLSGHASPEAIDGLIELSTDPDAHIRDWATFGLGQLTEVDTSALRAALHARLEDPCRDARNEAIEGLARRGDRSVVPVLIRELHEGVALPLLDAAIVLATPELCDALAAAAVRGLAINARDKSYDLSDAWAEARRTCGCEGSKAAAGRPYP